MEMILCSRPHKPASVLNWHKKSLRQCLMALGFTDKEMRCRKGASFLLDGWTGEIAVLLEMVKRRWKTLLIPLHEANGGNPEAWKNLNTIYSAAIQKIKPNLKREISKKKFMSFVCVICKRPFTKKIISWMQLKSRLCKNKECLREYRRLKAANARPRFHSEKFCENLDCQKRFIVPNRVGLHFKKFCSKDCRLVVWNTKNIERKRMLGRLNYAKNPKSREKYALLTEDQKIILRAKKLERIKKLRAKETPDQKIKRQLSRATYARLYRQRQKEDKIRLSESVMPLDKIEF